MRITQDLEGSLSGARLSIGRFTYGVELLMVRQWGEGAALRIGRFCSFADNIRILLGGNHRVDWITTYPFGHTYQDILGAQKIAGHPQSNGDVVIGNDVWVASAATILSGITIGDGAVIATNTTVVKDVAPYSIVGGNPGQHLKFRFDEEIRSRLLALRWWDLPIETIREIVPILCSNPNVEMLDRLLDKIRPSGIP